MREERIDVGGHTLRAQLLESDGPVTFVCLHGLVDTLEIWKRIQAGLIELGRVVLVDQRAHGRSDSAAGPCRREDLAADVLRVLDHFGLERIVLIGHSLGGIVAMTTALLYPERVAGLVLLGTASQCTERVAGWYEEIARAGEERGLEGLARAIYGPRTRRTVEGDPQGISSVTRALRSLYSDPLTPKLPALHQPVLLIVGDRDPMGPKGSEIIRDQLPMATLEILRDCGHWSHTEHPDAVLAAIRRWLGANRREIVGSGDPGS